MKKSLKFLTAVALSFLVIFVSCSKDDKKEFSADDAKVELQAASQEIMIKMAEMMTTPAVQSLDFFMMLSGFDDDWKSDMKTAISELQKPNAMTLRKIMKQNTPLKSQKIDPMDTGEYTFNFNTYDFDLTNPNVDYLKFYFPTNDMAMANGQLNGELTIANLDFIEIEYTDDWGTYTEMIPVSAQVTLVEDGTTLMTLNYSGSYNDEGMPLSISFDLNMAPYSMNMSFSGSGLNYSTSMTMRENNSTMMRYNLNVTYTPNQDDVASVSGYLEMAPLRFEGDMQPAAIDNCPEDNIACINNLIDVQLIHTGQNKIIGDIEFRLYTDPYWGDEYAEPVLVYSDGSWEYLYVVLGLDYNGFKFSLVQ